jgi:hypothetical protein
MAIISAIKEMDLLVISVPLKCGILGGDILKTAKPHVGLISHMHFTYSHHLDFVSRCVSLI